MDDSNMKDTNKDIFKYIDLAEIRALLIHEPRLYIIFEFVCTHINEYINNK